ncbi:DUF5799 family protein [Halovivax gelatinilyticus]|uniref:DUF5799 family protein n=1 Tax=Halovivax gelatinilyticus TaxID=2961597 RepID=UPI0020CA2B68|nr:DUF5799 family protein [Halovivax gelatinilyticus]
MTEWTDHIVGERMSLDGEFSSRVVDSRFTNQEWSLIMTATEFEIEDVEDPERAKIVADTEKVPHILPEFDAMRSQAGAMGGQPTGDAGGSGLFSSIKSAIGLGDDGVSEEELQAADRLAQEYASRLQGKLVANGRWDEIRQLAAGEEA